MVGWIQARRGEWTHAEPTVYSCTAPAATVRIGAELEVVLPLVTARVTLLATTAYLDRDTTELEKVQGAPQGRGARTK